MSKFTLIVQRTAQIDLDEAFFWYEEKRINLGFRFIEDFEQTLKKITVNPFFASKIDDLLRSASLKVFPYEVVYIVDEENYSIIVIAINHFKREPFWYKERN